MRHVVIMLGTILAAAGCGIRDDTVFKEKNVSPPPIVYCNSAIGHVEGNASWILGGKCCCTPTPEIFERLKKEGTVDVSMDYDSFQKLFVDKGINTDLNPVYVGTNNLNPYGPHVVKGGKDMGTPTPGTQNFEDVVSGVSKMSEREKAALEKYKKAMTEREELRVKIETEKNKGGSPK